MENPVLDKIKAFAASELTNTYGFCGLADGDETSILNSSDERGNDIKITIALKLGKSEFEQHGPGSYQNDDGGNLPNG